MENEIQKRPIQSADPSVTPPVFTPTPVEQSKPKFNLYYTGIGTILILVGMIGGYFLATNVTKSKQINTTKKAVVPSTVVVSPTSVPKDTAGWPSYEKKELGIKLNYPKDWFISSTAGSSFLAISPTKIDMTAASDGIPGPIVIGTNLCTDTVTNQQYPCEKTIEERAQKIKQTYSLQNVQEKSFMLLGKTALQLSGRAGEGNPLSGTYVKETMVDVDKYILVSTLYDKKYEEQYDKIVSSIEAIANSETSSWNTKLIQKVNWGDWKSFKISYPQSWSLEVNRTSYSDMENMEAYLKKGTYTMRFMQAPSDAGSCLYPEDTPYMGMVEEYASYTEIPKTNGIIWRNSKLKNYQSNFPGYTICEKNSGRNTFVGMTSIGIINLLDASNTFSTETISEVNDILRKIEITN